jgi:hypothetical protein
MVIVKGSIFSSVTPAQTDRKPGFCTNVRVPEGLAQSCLGRLREGSTGERMND